MATGGSPGLLSTDVPGVDCAAPQSGPALAGVGRGPQSAPDLAVLSVMQGGVQERDVTTISSNSELFSLKMLLT